jgi:hypothetical protein
MKITTLGLLLLLGFMPVMTACGLGGGEKAGQEESQREEAQHLKVKQARSLAKRAKMTTMKSALKMAKRIKSVAKKKMTVNLDDSLR